MNCMTRLYLLTPEFLKCTLPSVNLDMPIAAVKNRMENKVNPDETAPGEPSYLDLHYLPKQTKFGLHVMS